MSLSRVGLLALFPLALVAYACSSDDDDGKQAGVIDAGTDTGSSSGDTSKDSGSTPAEDSGTPAEDAAADASDGGAVVSCAGNPLGDNGDAGPIIVDSDAGALTPIATGHFLDGPQWIDDGIVYSEVTSQVIVKNTPDGKTRRVLRATAAGTDLPIGNGRTGGFLYTALSRTTPGGKGEILRMLIDGGDPIGFDAGEANSPNDLVASSKGFVYFTDPGYQNDGVSTGVYRLSPSGDITTITKIDGGVNARADGIALNAEENALFVGYFDQKRIVKYAVDAEGNASSPTDVALTLADGPTGLAMDTAGNLWVAESPADDSLHGQVEVFSPTGQRWGAIPFNDARPTGVAFGGADGLTVYVTTERGSGGEDGTLYTFKTRCAGVR